MSLKAAALRIGTVGATLMGIVGCSAAPPTVAPAAGPATTPDRAALQDRSLEVSSTSGTYEVQQSRERRRYRFRRILIGSRNFYVPYYFGSSYYLPYSLRTDPLWYYVYAYSGPNFTGTRRLIRIRRDRDRDRDWTDRNRNWDNPRMRDWRDGDRD